MKRRIPLFLAAVTCITFSISLSNAQPDRFRYESHSKVDPEGAGAVQAKISMFAGELNLMAASISSLLIGEYLYDDPEYGEPIRFYKVEDKTGDLRIENKELEHVDIDEDEHCRWNLQLNRNIPTELSIEMMAGEGNVMLEGAQINKLKFEMKAGEANIDLRNTPVSDLYFKAIAGEATIDLSGEWKNDLDAYLKGGVGNLNIQLPRHANIEAEVTGILGNVEASGLRKLGNRYTREISNRLPTLHIDITGGIGNINLEVEE